MLDLRISIQLLPQDREDKRNRLSGASSLNLTLSFFLPQDREENGAIKANCHWPWREKAKA